MLHGIRPPLYCINHTLIKLKSTNKELKSVAIQDMQKLPVGIHYYTDGSKSDSRAAAAFIVNKTVSCLRLNDDAIITQAKLVAIWGALEHAATNKNDITAIFLTRPES